MHQKILFTPVGGTDPISATNCFDGAILHICRHYQPDKVIMYMSKEMLVNQEKDDRYRYCLNKLCELQNRKMECEIIERRELTNVHEFDFYYEDFQKIIHGIYGTMDETDELLLNVSSGTPAMKSGLLVLQTMEEYPAKLIQVATPERRINEHHYKDYDVFTLWELDEDNQPGADNRCSEIACPSLQKLKKEEVIKKHILSYDYRAALTVADTMGKQDTQKYRGYLELAEKRLLLDISEVDKLAKKLEFDCIPVKASSERMLFEYALGMQIKLKNGEYVDFIRAITPILVDLFELVLKVQCKIDINNYCKWITKRDGTKLRRWDIKKLRGTEIEKVLNEAFSGSFNQNGDVYSIHIKALIEYFSTDAQLKELICNLRLTEEKIRNNNPNEAEISEVIEAEGERILKKIGAGDYAVAMCIEGKQLSSEELSAMLDNAAITGKSTVDFIIGGSYGLSNKVKNRADFKLSMSKMTFPHQMARMVLSEQIYRAFEISTNGKYHK